MTKPIRVLILEDRPADAELMVREPGRADAALNGLQALLFLQQRGLDLPPSS